jgi:hypothetical protein
VSTDRTGTVDKGPRTSVLTFGLVVGPLFLDLASSLRFFIASDFTTTLMSPRFLLSLGSWGRSVAPQGWKPGWRPKGTSDLTTTPLFESYFQHLIHAFSATKGLLRSHGHV